MIAATKNLNGFGTVPRNWDVAALPEVVFYQEGPGLRKWQWTASGMKVINVTNILGDGRIDTNNTSRFISIEEYEKTYRHFTVDVDDIVVASSGNTYGKIGRISAKDLPLMMNTSVIRLHSKDKLRLDDDFLYAFLRSDLFANQVESFVIGSAQPNFGPSHLKQMVMPLPPLPVQRRIAGILSAYDDLIENNQRRIKILEEMARSLYREWFVLFRFPGHEKVKMVPSCLGPIPQGWDVKPLNDVVEDIVDYRGKTPTKLKGEWASEGILALSALNVKGGRLVSLEKSKLVSEELYSRWMKTPLKSGDILMTSEAPLGELFFLCKEERYCLSQRLYSIRANRRVIAPIILYLCLESEQTQYELSSRARAFSD